jgi:hypothetical protein
MGRYDLDITTDKKGYIKFVWPHDRPHDMMQTRRISFFSYLPDSVSEWPPNKNGQTPLFLIRDMELKEGGKGTAQLTYAVLPTDLDVLKIKDSLKLECGLSDKDDQPVIQKSTADARQIFGSFRTSYSPGNAFGNGNTLTMMPMLGTNVFHGTLSRSIRVYIDWPTEKGRNARSWFAGLKP